jgi:CheY-like chemotaxis protein
MLRRSMQALRTDPPQPVPKAAGPAQVQRLQAGSEEEGAATGGRKILVVDDQEASADTLTLLLEMEGFQVLVAREGHEALVAARAFQPEVVLLDIGLPGMSGYEVAAHLRADPACREALLVAITGYGEPETRARSARAGFDVHLVKPADVDRLLGLLANPQAARRTLTA